MLRSPEYPWQSAYNAVCTESDPDNVPALLELAVVALERRSAQWDDEPGTEAEVRALLESISTLRKRLSWYLDIKSIA
jgi:hypothetical protein